MNGHAAAGEKRPAAVGQASSTTSCLLRPAQLNKASARSDKRRGEKSGTIGKAEKQKAWRGRRMRQALNLIDNWEEEDVVDPYRTTLGGGGASFDAPYLR
jgi:hypothetical protein